MADGKTIEFRGDESASPMGERVAVLDENGRVSEWRGGISTLAQADPANRPALSGGWLVRRDADGVFRVVRQF
jgi:hypothetical protein